MTARNKVLTIMGIIILIGIISIGFFVFPIGISMCAITGLCYGCKYKDKLFIRWSSVGLVTGIGLSIYTWLFNLVNVKQHKFSKKKRGYDNPSISPFTISICNACGSFGNPGIRIISPAMTTSISAPAFITISCTWNSKLSTAP